jgi:hypothetical protein
MFLRNNPSSIEGKFSNQSIACCTRARVQTWSARVSSFSGIMTLAFSLSHLDRYPIKAFSTSLVTSPFSALSVSSCANPRCARFQTFCLDRHASNQVLGLRAIAPTGQVETQRPQPKHREPSKTSSPPSRLLAPNTHRSTHLPHPTHFL